MRARVLSLVLMKTRLVLETRLLEEVLRAHRPNALSVWAPPSAPAELTSLPRLRGGAALQQGRGWEQKGGEVGNWKMLAPAHDNSNLILHKSS